MIPDSLPTPVRGVARNHLTRITHARADADPPEKWRKWREFYAFSATDLTASSLVRRAAVARSRHPRGLYGRLSVPTYPCARPHRSAARTATACPHSPPHFDL